MFFKNSLIILKTKEKEKPTIKNHIDFNTKVTRGCRVHNKHAKTPAQVALQGLSACKAAARRTLSQEQGLLQPSALTTCPAELYFIHKAFCTLLLSEGKADFDLSHSTMGSDGESYQCLCHPHTNPSSPVHYSAGLAPQRKVT